MLQRHVVRVLDARVVQFGGFDLILWQLLCRREGGKGQESTSNEHVGCCSLRGKNTDGHDCGGAWHSFIPR
jgi:hypothetical protein